MIEFNQKYENLGKSVFDVSLSLFFNGSYRISFSHSSLMPKVKHFLYLLDKSSKPLLKSLICEDSKLIETRSVIHVGKH